VSTSDNTAGYRNPQRHLNHRSTVLYTVKVRAVGRTVFSVTHKRNSFHTVSNFEQ
jgi:hypothetical protein